MPKKSLNVPKNLSPPPKGKRYILVMFFILLVLVLLAFDLASKTISEVEESPKCGDGSFYNTCSLTKPYYCQTGTLVEKASVCGCDFDLTKSGEFCVSEYEESPENVILNYVLNGKENKLSFVVYGEAQSYVQNISRVISYRESEAPFRVDFKLRSVNEETQRRLLLPLVKEIENTAPNSKIDQARIAISIVQNIPYGFSDKIVLFENQEINYSRYPYEVLYENEGICGEKSQLLTFLLKELGYGVSIFYFEEENHEAVGIRCPIKESFMATGFCFVETGGQSIISDSSMEFVGGEKLESTPEVLLISEGISLPDDLEEYDDADILEDIREGNILGILNSWRLESINEKYDLNRIYNLR